MVFSSHVALTVLWKQMLCVSQSALDINGICNIVGWPGTGKTSLGQELLKRNREFFQPLQLRDPKDWYMVFHKDRTRDPNEKRSLIFIDSVLYDDVNALGARLPIWQKLFHDIEPEVGNGRAKVILAFRKQGYTIVRQDPRGTELLKRAPVVSLDALVPTDKQKVSIYRNLIAHRNFIPDLSPKHVKVMASQPNAMGFPECCSIYSKSTDFIPKDWYLFSTRQREEEMGAEMHVPEIFGAIVREGVNFWFDAARDGYRRLLEVYIKPNVDASMRQWDYNLDVNDNTVLHFIAQQKDSDAMKRALSEISNVDNFIDNKNNKGETALHIAVKNGMAESVQLLLEKGADPALTDSEGNTVSHLVVTQEDGLIIHILANWRRALKPRLKNSAGMTPLHVAAAHGNVEGAGILLTSGADVAARDEEGCTCLHHVARNGKAEVAEKLLQLGADVTIEDNEGEVPIMTAIQAGNEETALLLLNHSPKFVILKNKAGDFPLHLALKKCMVKLAKAMMRNGTDVASKGSQGQTPLMLASTSGDLDLVKWMLEKTESILTIAEKDENEETAADIAARLQHLDIHSLLMEKGREQRMLQSNQCVVGMCQKQ